MKQSSGESASAAPSTPTSSTWNSQDPNPPRGESSLTALTPKPKMSAWNTVVLRGIQWVASLGWIATLCAWLASLWWPLELATHFRMQYVFVFVFCIIGFAIYRRYWMVGLCAVGLVAHLWVLMPAFLSASSGLQTNTTYHSVRGMLANVNSMNKNASLLIRSIRKHSPGFVVLLEVSHDWKEALQPLKKVFPYSLIHPRLDNFGIALLSRFPAQISLPVIGEAGFPSIMAKIQRRGTSFTVVGTHPLPPISGETARLRDQQFDALANVMRSLKGPAMLVGDLNMSPWSPSFHKLLKNSGLKDSSRGFGFQASWPAGFPPLYTPIDHVLLSPTITVKHRAIGPPIGSDHFPVLFEVNIP